MSRPPLQVVPRTILVAWGVVVVVLTGIAFASAGGSVGWEDLVRIATLILGGMALSAVGLTWLIARTLMSTSTTRTVTAAVGPPLLAVAGIGLLQLF